MKIDKLRVRRAFERAAADYRARAGLQDEIGARLLERLEGLRIAPAVVIDGGCGAGAHSRILAAKFPRARIIAVDSALAMLRQIAPDGRIARIKADVENLPLAAAAAQFYWSNLCWQWADDLKAAIAEARRALAPGGLLLFSALGRDTLRELRAAFAAVDDLPHVGQFPDMHDLGDWLAAGGFEEPVMETEKIVLTYAEVADAVRDLKRAGATAVYRGMARGLTGKDKWRRMTNCYRERFARADGKIPATFELIYAHAWRAAPAERAVRIFRQALPAERIELPTH